MHWGIQTWTKFKFLFQNKLLPFIAHKCSMRPFLSFLWQLTSTVFVLFKNAPNVKPLLNNIGSYSCQVNSRSLSILFSMIMLWITTHNIKTFVITSLSHCLLRFVITWNLACRTLRQCSTSFYTLSWHFAKCCHFSPCGSWITWTKIDHLRYIPLISR
jgi:hypothetical protein